MPLPSQIFRTSQQAWPSISTTYHRYRLLPSQTLNASCCLSTSARISSQFRRSDFAGQPFTNTYEPPITRGPLSNSAANGVPKLTPRELKKYLDKYVVGQERSKVALSTAIYNHYQLILRRQRLKEEEEKRVARVERAESFRRQRLEEDERDRLARIDRADLFDRHPADSVDDFQDHSTVNENNQRSYHPDRYHDRHQERKVGGPLLEEYRPTNIEKSNVLMLGPTGVGKTLIAKTLARVLDVPIAMCDCTPLTQAGYIGQDVESSVHRLLQAADFDPVKAENGIIFFDETDKIATAKVAHGKDVSGEGVQQALLKIIEGTTVQISAKEVRGNPRNSSNSGAFGNALGNSSSMSNNPFPKEETFNIKTDNILFIFAGAFVGLDKIVRNRISKSSIGFGSPLRNTSKNGMPSKAEAALIRKSLPFFSSRSNENYSVLDLVDPEDLGNFGFIPEFIGRIPTITALSHLSIDDLMRILTETKDCKVQQYTTLFKLSGVELRFTTPALQIIAQRALDRGTGARGLVSVMENLLKEAMYDSPGTSIKHILVNRSAAKLECAPLYFARGQESTFHSLFKQEQQEWEVEKARERRAKEGSGDGEAGSFEEFREQAKSGM